MALWSWPEGVKSLSPGACRANQSSLPFCQWCPAGPASPAENCARGSCLGKRTRRHKSPPENEEGRRMVERTRRDSLSERHCLHNQVSPFRTLQGRTLAHASVTHEVACKVHFQQESSKLTQPWQCQAILPHLECTVSGSSFSKHLSELFLQVKLHRCKEKSGDWTRRSIQTPHLIKHPIHNCLH